MRKYWDKSAQHLNMRLFQDYNKYLQSTQHGELKQKMSRTGFGNGLDNLPILASHKMLSAVSAGHSGGTMKSLK